ncbi:fatty acyl-AMP ligase [Actinocrispum sp. NPDC049592]|uniref:fatty acyl-AMP ligase n=1 Tax=Actinocrispum sp. NPDC049592 TaxID=3154835 RepID=UPI003433288A
MNTTTVPDLLRARAAERAGGYGFIVDGEPEPARLPMSWLYQRALAVAAGIDAPAGARAVLIYPPGLDFIVGLFAAMLAGVVAVPVYPPGSGGPAANASARLNQVLADCKPEVILSTADVIAVKDTAGIGTGSVRWLATDTTTGASQDWRPPRVSGDDIAIIQYSSGSTGTPKGVVLRHRNVLANLAAIETAMGLTRDSVIVGWVPSYHDMGLIGYILAAVRTGCWSYLMSPSDFLRRPAIWLESISRVRGTVAGGPNFGYELCLRRVTDAERTAVDLSSWRVAFSGAEKIRPSVLRRFGEAFDLDEGVLYPCYGLAEACLIVSGARPGSGLRSVWLDRRALEQGKVAESTVDAVEIAACGRPVEAHELLIVDPASATPLGAGQVGEVWVRGPSVAGEYWHRPEESGETFGATLGDGSGPFLRTGDLGFLRDGELYLTGRSKDLLIIAGRNIYPTDIEEAAQAADRRLRAGCGVAVELPGPSHNLVAVIQETTEQDPDELAGLAVGVRRSVAERMEIVVDTVVLIEQRTIPKTSSGKLRRSATRQDYSDGRLAVRYEWRRPGAGEA